MEEKKKKSARVPHLRLHCKAAKDRQWQIITIYIHIYYMHIYVYVVCIKMCIYVGEIWKECEYDVVLASK